VTVGEHALHSVGVDALLPATGHYLAPRLRRRPLTVDVRFVQDDSSLARDPLIMEQRVGISTDRVHDQATRPLTTHPPPGNYPRRRR
jgi:hypothetical protein